MQYAPARFDALAGQRQGARPSAPAGPRGGGADGVFLHAMWRSGSSFVWSRFRAAAGTCCYYEPLHHGLAKLNRRRLAREAQADARLRHHPVLERHYLAEFEPLLSWRGVRRHRPSFAYDRMVLRPDELHPPLARYLTGLTDHARAQGLAPVFGFNRSSFRIGWMRRRFDARHVYIDRDPEAIWSSYVEQAQAGNLWFLANWLAVLERNRDTSLLAPLAERMPLRSPRERLLTKRKAFYLRAAAQMGPDQSYRLVFYLWLASAAHGLGEADLALDMSRMDGADYRRVTADRVAALTGLAVTLDGARTVAPAIRLERGQARAIEREVLGFFPRPAQALIRPSDVRARLAELSPAKADRLSMIL